MKKMSNKKGFTLMEMLIVVAIIVILVAIAIPTFSNALTKANEAADMANIRAWYAEEVLDNMLNGEDYEKYDASTLNYSAKLTVNEVDETTGELKITYTPSSGDALVLNAKEVANG